MSISINVNNCIGCKKCINVCPGSLIKLDENNKAFIKYPKDCWGCSSCIKECESCAISFFLGADIGGKGSLMTADFGKDEVTWNIKESNGTTHNIEINPKDANKY